MLFLLPGLASCFLSKVLAFPFPGYSEPDVSLPWPPLHFRNTMHFLSCAGFWMLILVPTPSVTLGSSIGNADKDEEQQEHISFAGAVKCYCSLRKMFGQFLTKRNKLSPKDPVVPHLSVHKGNRNLCPHTIFCKQICGSFIHNYGNSQATKLFFK